jgi:hypothetical protein
MTLTEARKRHLHGSYLDRITETAMHFANGRAVFDAEEWREYISDEFSFLRELTAEEQQYLRDLAAADAIRRSRENVENNRKRGR